MGIYRQKQTVISHKTPTSENKHFYLLGATDSRFYEICFRFDPLKINRFLIMGKMRVFPIRWRIVRDLYVASWNVLILGGVRSTLIQELSGRDHFLVTMKKSHLSAVVVLFKFLKNWLKNCGLFWNVLLSSWHLKKCRSC